MGGGPRILIVGGGYGGMHTALCLERLLRPGEATVTIADPRSYMTYQPLLAEAAAGNLEPRHVVVPLRGVLRRTQVIKAAVSSVDHGRRAAHLASGDGAERTVGYDLLVLAPGSVSRVLPIPGLAEAGIGFKTIGEAIHLRNHVLGRLDAAAAAASDDVRRAALTFVFAGGGYAGVEALAELQDMAFGAGARYPELSPRDMRWILVEAADRILPEVSTKMAGYTTDLLRRRHIEVRLQTRLASAGSVASLGLYRGVAEVYGLRMHGFPAWMTHRTYHLLRLPTLNRRLHVGLRLDPGTAVLPGDRLPRRARAPSAGLPGRAGPHRQRATSGAGPGRHGKGRKRGQGRGRSCASRSSPAGGRSAARPGGQRGRGAGGTQRERTRHERAREHGRLGARLPPGQAPGGPAGSRGHRPVPGMRGPQQRHGVRAPRRVHPSGRAAVRRRGDRRHHRMLAARLPLRPVDRPGTVPAGHPAGRRLPRPDTRGRRTRTPGCPREQPPLAGSAGQEHAEEQRR
jgi:NADH dehydrogenase FAD-containing subunit